MDGNVAKEYVGMRMALGMSAGECIPISPGLNGFDGVARDY